MAHHVFFKMPRARKAGEFTVYPFSAGTESLKLQSDNHCMIVFVSGERKGKTLVSKRFAQYPRFEACSPAFGGKEIETPAEITEQVEKILNAPTGETIQLV